MSNSHCQTRETKTNKKLEILKLQKLTKIYLFPLDWNRGLTGERTVKRLRLSKALTVPETTTIHEACRRMAARRVDALLLTDSNALLCGILTDKV